MKKILTLLFATTLFLSSCQNDEFTENQSVENPKETVVSNEKFRLYPTNVTTRDANTIYIDFEPQNRQVLFYIESGTLSADRIASNYNIEIFTRGSFNFLGDAYNSIESENPGSCTNTPLYSYITQGDQIICMNGPYYEYYVAYYSKTPISTTNWKFSVDRLLNEISASNSVRSYVIPTRIKISHKFGGPTFIYDINMHFIALYDYKGSWRFEAP